MASSSRGRRRQEVKGGVQPSGRAERGTRGGPSSLGALQDWEGMRILHRILEHHPELRPEVETLAREILTEGTFEDIAEDVLLSLETLAPEDAWARAGRRESGYVEPIEAATEILEEALEPFHEDMRRNLDAGIPDQARQVCMGIVLGLYRASREGKCPLLQEAPDFPEEAAAWALEKWREFTGGQVPGRRARKGEAPGSPLSAEFLEKWVPEWKGLRLDEGP